MKKTLICLLLVLSLALLLAACSTKPAPEPEPEPAPEPAPVQEVVTTPATIDQETSGVSYDLPAAMQNLKGVIRPSYGYELASGLWLSGLTYYAMTPEKFTALSEQDSFTTEDQNFADARVLDLLRVFAIDGGRGQAELGEALSAFGLNGADYQPLGKVGEYSFFCHKNPVASFAENQAVFDEGFREEYDAIVAALDDLSWVRIYEPRKTQTAEAGTAVSFRTVDLAGSPVNSEDIFSAHKLTMVNIWGTFCGPCINEMPDLEVLNGRLADKDCAIIGVVCDVAGPEDDGHIQAAGEIIGDTGVTYRNLIPWDGFDAALPAEYIPTTYFVDSEGKLVGEPAVGARGADDYEALLDAALAALG